MKAACKRLVFSSLLRQKPFWVLDPTPWGQRGFPLWLAGEPTIRCPVWTPGIALYGLFGWFFLRPGWFPHMHGLLSLQLKFGRKLCMCVCVCVSSSCLARILPCKLQPPWPLWTPDSISSTQGDHQAPLGLPLPSPWPGNSLSAQLDKHLFPLSQALLSCVSVVMSENGYFIYFVDFSVV